MIEYANNDYEYYQHPTNQFELTEYTIELLEDKLLALQQVYQTRYRTYQHSTTKIKAIWEEFNIPILERPILPTLLGEDDMLIVNFITYSLFKNSTDNNFNIAQRYYR